MRFFFLFLFEMMRFITTSVGSIGELERSTLNYTLPVRIFIIELGKGSSILL